VAITDTIGRLGTTLVAMLQTRLELAAVEVEEESRRLLGYLILSLLALFLFGIAIMLVALFVIILFWDSYRVEAVLGMASLFVLAAIGIGIKVRASFGAKPRLLAATIGELRKDIDFVNNASPSHEH
jgi:uncharacterized membrane protein YqjE